jgi:tRNA-(ms[2]io[6]A)-hydroxylase
LALSDPGRLLQDHAHCEKKAAATALSMVSAVPDRTELVGPLTALAQEETRHFFRVLAEIERRGLALGRCPVDPYARELQLRVRGSGSTRLRDRMLVGCLIEARSCERFSLLASHCTDDRLKRLWGDLFEAEAEHHTLFLKLAGVLGGPEAARARLDELAEEEAAIVAGLPLRIGIH